MNVKSSVKCGSIAAKFCNDKIDNIIGKSFDLNRSSTSSCGYHLLSNYRHAKSQDMNKSPSHGNVISIRAYSSLFLLGEDSMYTAGYKMVLVLNDDHMGLSSVLNAQSFKGMLGGSIVFSMRFNEDKNCLVGQFSQSDVTEPTSLKFEIMNFNKSATSMLFRMSTDDVASEQLLENLTVTFIRENSTTKKLVQDDISGTIHRSFGAIARNLHEGVHISKSLTAFCNSLEVESLAAWSILRMMELQEAPHGQGKGIETHTNFTSSTNAVARDQQNGFDVNNKPVLVPSYLRKWILDRKSDPDTLPMTYDEIKVKLAKLRRIEGAASTANTKNIHNGCGLFLENNSTILRLMDPHKGLVPIALKTALFFSLDSRQRNMVSLYHKDVLNFSPLDNPSVNIFCKFRPSDKYTTIFSFGQRLEQNAYVSNLERFEAPPMRMSDPKYWTFVGETIPQKNLAASMIKFDNCDFTNFPVTPLLSNTHQQNDIIHSRVASNAIEIAPGCFLHIELWPQELQNSDSMGTDQLAKLYCVTLSITDSHFHSMSGVNEKVVKYLLDVWLAAVPRSQFSLLPTSYVNDRTQ